ncbi:MAG: pantoate--beta-alanine ligase [Gammaproteobacteria bacterium]
MKTIYDTHSLRTIVQRWRNAQEKIAFVPTMGNLHDGHLTLLSNARELADRTVVSIFVNPIQFGKGEDYENYPSTLRRDGQKLAEKGADILFAPNLQQLYPGGMAEDTRVSVPSLSDTLCGKFRPGHFSGVATVVTKLFFSVLPDIALFGEKDYQQLLVIKRMVSDLCIPVEVIGQPIVRESDGLAMSSRNSYLSVDERSRAAKIYQELTALAEQIRGGDRNFTAMEEVALENLKAAGFKPEYVSVRRLEDLEHPRDEDRDFSVLAAAWLGSARLIDNIKVQLSDE